MGNNTQTPKTKALARLIRKSYREIKSWRKVARLYKISAALAHRIAKRGYEPVGLELRRRLGLPADECPECHQHLDGHVDPPSPKPALRTWRHLDDLTPAQVRYLFDHRECLA